MAYSLFIIVLYATGKRGPYFLKSSYELVFNRILFLLPLNGQEISFFANVIPSSFCQNGPVLLSYVQKRRQSFCLISSYAETR